MFPTFPRPEKHRGIHKALHFLVRVNSINNMSENKTTVKVGIMSAEDGSIKVVVFSAPNLPPLLGAKAASGAKNAPVEDVTVAESGAEAPLDESILKNDLAAEEATAADTVDSDRAKGDADWNVSTEELSVEKPAPAGIDEWRTPSPLRKIERKGESNLVDRSKKTTKSLTPIGRVDPNGFAALLGTDVSEEDLAGVGSGNAFVDDAPPSSTTPSGAVTVAESGAEAPLDESILKNDLAAEEATAADTVDSDRAKGDADWNVSTEELSVEKPAPAGIDEWRTPSPLRKIERKGESNLVDRSKMTTKSLTPIGRVDPNGFAALLGTDVSEEDLAGVGSGNAFVDDAPPSSTTPSGAVTVAESGAEAPLDESILKIDLAAEEATAADTVDSDRAKGDADWNVSTEELSVEKPAPAGIDEWKTPSPLRKIERKGESNLVDRSKKTTKSLTPIGRVDPNGFAALLGTDVDEEDLAGVGSGNAFVDDAPPSSTTPSGAVTVAESGAEAPLDESILKNDLAAEEATAADTVDSDRAKGDADWNVSTEELSVEKPAPAGIDEWRTPSPLRKIERKGESNLVDRSKMTTKSLTPIGRVDPNGFAALLGTDVSEEDLAGVGSGNAFVDDAPPSSTTPLETEPASTCSGFRLRFGKFCSTNLCSTNLLCIFFSVVIGLGCSAFALSSYGSGGVSELLESVLDLSNTTPENEFSPTVRGTAIASPAALPTETETACGALVAPFNPAPDPVPDPVVPGASHLDLAKIFWFFGPALLLTDLLPGAKAQPSSPPPTPWPFLLAFVAGECIDDIHKVRSADACLELGGSYTSSTGAVTDYATIVNMYSSGSGVAISSRHGLGQERFHF
ncbi:hypothetical protein EMIHUDRAFT_213454 [Emiliania huxleyi CCMP1516]|uniref:Uncharacterized protein n=2 Tax=Emiliania huxleyi TaxID=2903 RepID=A0A0D3IN43_EMIH1|nr:hypothetical protein EMIHUDRAFT_213454 [Emiliania huxleyi CCMP1516]EOD12678.1 hypothetical protein EMIHUDRAFT_213454 [Emiliania huxleyi CCMP1516]|eukprot:XP_005765107.1 hypothetical protein EMIHUDRAFT_213454 [Emiliania huxleyi CCMP1516]